ncbi:hypothetical protein CANCADRAFT_109346 [Tortispora caseinolytica NRRL Y-17796]|uniref:R3H domain-containing protein n=1 Tax=Tortispora caseinolytica NRRL Y-17796 TaxID=767744 RepID=A0A1E4TG16_9ASCO|nr:hypothetical protein CANCADRAFT_109346 [Tortispora caseinolytica NRRL Y-17796]
MEKVNIDMALYEALEKSKYCNTIFYAENEALEVLHRRKDYCELPAANSYERLLLHKIADYYRLSHTFDSYSEKVKYERRANYNYHTFPEKLVDVHPKIKEASESGDLTYSGYQIMKSASSGSRSSGGTDKKSRIVSATTTDPSSTSASYVDRNAQYEQAKARIFSDTDFADPTDGNTTSTANIRDNSSRVPAHMNNLNNHSYGQTASDPNSTTYHNPYFAPYYNGFNYGYRQPFVQPYAQFTCQYPNYNLAYNMPMPYRYFQQTKYGGVQPMHGVPTETMNIPHCQLQASSENSANKIKSYQQGGVLPMPYDGLSNAHNSERSLPSSLYTEPSTGTSKAAGTSVSNHPVHEPRSLNTSVSES